MSSNGRINISSGAKWEDIVGYSRAVKVGNNIYIAGTTAVDNDGKVIGVNDPYLQTLECLRIIEQTLIKAKAKLTDIVRTRIFVKNINDWERIGEAHGEIFKKIKPATTMVEVNKLILPELLVEIEADAVIK